MVCHFERAGLMNWQLFTDEEKRANRSGRLSRRRINQWKARRNAKVRRISNILVHGLCATEEIPGEMYWDLKHGHGNRSRRLASKLSRLKVIFGDDPIQLPACGPEELLQVTRPSRVLNRRNRGWVFEYRWTPGKLRRCGRY